MLTKTLQLYKHAYRGLNKESWYLSAVMLINRSGTMVLPFMTMYCTQKLHFSTAQAGIVMAMFGCGSIGGAFIGGKLTDRLGFYSVQIGALFLGGGLFIITGFFSALPVLCAEERFSKIFLYFSLLSLLIACLGLYGLISYTVFQKTKEIGIRKVLGATASRIAVILSGGFIKLVLFACVISAPIAWYVMNKWLQDFAYHISLSWWMFTVAGVLVLFIALVTVSVQSIKAAIANPVKNLRTE